MAQPGGRVLVTREELAQRVGELGRAVARDYAEANPLLVCVLKGAVVFFADLIRAVDIPLTTDFISVASYGGGSASSGVVKIASDLSITIENRDVILIEDIIDSGRTISYLKRNMETRHPKSLRICALLDKVERRQVEVDLDYVGFTIPNVFIVGYGMDHGGLYRNLPYLAALDGA
ncbi:MAG: hypoxanthine phosphoribosyltransferase [Candidatus Rokuibacteriota bacterium]|nr:MAG: hypoxanthine phosphoribosyltransferase [Candidatus Rokubacteria bacterium]